jgi:hypothetical protein
MYAPCLYGSAGESRAYLDTYKHILIICVYEDHWEDRGPRRFSLHRFRATVVRSYKGDWKVGERIAIVHATDARALSTPNGDAGCLMFAFTDKHKTSEISLETGSFGNYSPDLERLLQSLFPQHTATPANFSVERMAADDACLQILTLVARRHRSPSR